MSVSLNSVMLIGFVSGTLITSDCGIELTLLVHPFAEKYHEALALQSSGVPVRVRVSAACEEYAELLREGDRVYVMGSLCRSNRTLSEASTPEVLPLVDGFRIERMETLKAISRFNHPLHPNGFALRLRPLSRLGGESKKSKLSSESGEC